MADLALIVLRLAQFAAAAILMGSSLFLVYGLPRETLAPMPVPGARLLVLMGAVGLAATAALGLIAQTTVLAGSLDEALKPASLQAVIGTMSLGKAAMIRMACSVVAAFLLVALGRSERWIWTAVGVLGIVATATFAWSGHGATSDGTDFWVHLLSDVLHAWAAAAWIGALVVFGLLLRDRGNTPDELARTHRALSRFSTVGTLFVLTLLVTGLINGWYLVGLDHTAELVSSRYGELLLLKVAAFVAMLALAAANRFRLTPRLEGHLAVRTYHPLTLRELRRSIAVETLLGVAALGLVAWFGTLEPPMAM